MTLADKALLVDLKVHGWSATKADKEVSAKAAEDFNAQQRVGSYTKKLLPAEAFRDVYRVWQNIYNTHQLRTLPWSDSGLRILSGDQWFDYSAAMRGLKRDWDKAVDEFVGKYQNLIDAYAPALGDMYMESDYPTAEQVKAKFGFDWRIMPVPQGSDFRVDVEDKEEVQKEIDEQTKEATAKAMREVAKRIEESMTHMVDILDKADARSNVLKDSVVENLKTFSSILPGLNLTNDPVIAEVSKLIEGRLATLEGKQLRSSESDRAVAKDAAEEILEKMKGFYA